MMTSRLAVAEQLRDIAEQLREEADRDFGTARSKMAALHWAEFQCRRLALELDRDDDPSRRATDG